MAIKLTPESFLNVVKQSNLVTGDVLKRLISEMQSQGVPVDSSRSIADQLVERNLLTRWQADKLLQGKHKGFFLGKYRLLKLLGKGGMSSVYLAEHVLMRRQCAIKVLPTKRVNDTSYLGRFHREAQAVASLDHPNIIKAYDVDKEMEKDTEIHFLVMEFVDGRSLQEIVQQDGPLDFQSAAEYIRQSAAGLAHAHQAGMVHRDIKPGNLLIDRSGVVKLLDMGLARFFNDGDEESLTVAHDEKVLGTADYLAPEQALDSHSVDARADIYSLGCTFYFLLTGHPPFTEGTLAQRLMSHQTKQPPPVTQDRPDTPSDLLAIIDKMMAKKRDERYQTADEVSDDLADWLIEHGSEEWRQQHAGLSGSGKKLTDSGKNLPTTPPMAKPVVPVAQPVVMKPEAAQPVPEPEGQPPAPLAAPDPAVPEPRPAEPVMDAGNELSDFLANLGSSDSGPSEVHEFPSSDEQKENKPPEASPAPAQAHEAKPAVPVAPAKPATPVAQPVPPTSKPPIAAPIAQPSPQPPPTQPAKPAVPVASTVSTPSTSSAVAEEPHFPAMDENDGGSGFAIDTSSDATSPTIATRRSRSATKKPQSSGGLQKLLQHKKILMGVGGAALVLLLGFGIYWMVAGGGESENSGSVGGFGGLDDPSLIGPPIPVGPSENIKTIKDALDYVTRHAKALPVDEPQILQLAAGEVFEERIALDNSDPTKEQFPFNIQITTDAKNPATLKPEGADPIIQLIDGVNHLQIQNLKLAAEGKDAAVRLRGELDNTRLVGLTISGYKSAGIEMNSAYGRGKLGDEERAFVIEGVTFQGSGNASGIRMANTGSILDPKWLEEIVVRDCRFLGPFQAGIQVENAVTRLLVLSNIFAGKSGGVGIQFTGRPELTKVLIANNTFYQLDKGITFTDTPQLVVNTSVQRNLFADLKGPEAALLKGDATKFPKAFSASTNVTMGSKTKGNDKQELKLFADKSSKAGVNLEFASTDPSSSQFLAPKGADSLPQPAQTKIKLGPDTVEIENQIGAVKP